MDILKLNQIKSLTLNSCYITSSQISDLLVGLSSRLETLKIMKKYYGESDDVISFPTLSLCTKLKKLELRNVTMIYKDHIELLYQCKSLEYIHMVGCKITNFDFKAFQPGISTTFPNLKYSNMGIIMGSQVK